MAVANVVGLDLMATAIDPDTGTVRVGARLAYALAAAELVTLADARRVELRTGVLAAVADEPVEDVRAADALERLLRLPKPITVYDWLRQRGPYRIDAYIAALEDGGLIRLTAMVGGGKRITVVNAGELRAVHRRLEEAYAFPPMLSAEDFELAVLAVASRGGGFGFGSPSRVRRRLVKRALGAGGGSGLAGFAGASGSAGFAGSGTGPGAAAGLVDAEVRALLRECLAAVDGLARSGGTGRTDDERMGLSEAGRWAGIASLFPNA
jgi:hypothetical protein